MQSFQKKKKAKLFNREDANHIWVSPGITVRPNWNEGCGGYQKRISGIIDQAIAIHFPEVILEDILSRLPVKSLLRFKCVSKFWETLISEPYFKMKHLSCAKIDQDSRKLLTIQMCSKNRMFSMYCCPLSPIQLVEDVHKLSFPSNPTVSHCIIHCCMMAWLLWRFLILLKLITPRFFFGIPPQENQQYFLLRNFNGGAFLVMVWVMTQPVVGIRSFSIIRVALFLVKFSR
nr:uncharacterized protein LOC101261682 isoform X2 [Solanum lycopersicum]